MHDGYDNKTLHNTVQCLAASLAHAYAMIGADSSHS